ncbi:precorrin-2 dehydrogenase/sirohydrochlorin ferrochelatase family protein [Evansella cellulosilytica]|uniref:precorrin-2 dehydrogenase n=1 Tax=Evansella cellulosilytica (strain ATCC 21833 / DSM 2522 / FERM P-1141 / JCM 9156 / N-4) TaxID=649639 RepID=E6U1A7_EVAC2|nr:bifunctional precorrin-2 dehydrogenase/sirohydrochlorin ferrochelatase [Evansella cellulosilytica]ADU29154.1 siroheme synthase [Evansella cellulosilytica DSM 2522]
MAKFTPCMVKLNGKKAVVVGGGKVAYRKVQQLLSNQCKVKVISPDLCDELDSIIDQCDYENRSYVNGDTEGSFIVIAATNDKAINEAIYEDAQQAPFINIVDNQKLSNFFLPAVVDRGALQIAISTTGTSPIFTKKIREQLETLFGTEYEAYLEKIGELRQDIIKQAKNVSQKKELLEQLTDDELLEAFRENDETKIEAYISNIRKSLK